PCRETVGVNAPWPAHKSARGSPAAATGMRNNGRGLLELKAAMRSRLSGDQVNETTPMPFDATFRTPTTSQLLESVKMFTKPAPRWPAANILPSGETATLA